MTKNLAVTQTATAEAAKAELAKKGLYLPPKPRYQGAEDGPPRISVRVSDLSDDELMALFVACTRWTDYLGGEVAVAEVDLRAYEAVLAKAQNTALLRDWATADKDAKVTIAKAERANDPTVMEWQEKVDTQYAMVKLLRPIYEACERDAQMLSRELSRRLGRADIERRADSGAKGRPR